MATSTRRNPRKRPSRLPEGSLLTRYLPAWLLLAGVLVILLPQTVTFTARAAVTVVTSVGDWVGGLFTPHPVIAPLFTDQVKYWADDIRRWSEEYNLDPNLLATVMQIESCGHPTVSSPAGAQGLFQVMPYHFDMGEDQLDPDTNAKRSADVLKDCLNRADGDAGLAMACYNGGPSVIQTNYAYWSSQVRSYYTWGTGIYQDAINDRPYSDTLTHWLAAGGVYLCDKAGIQLGIN